MIKGSIQDEDLTTINIYTSNIGASQYIRQTLTDIKGEIDSLCYYQLIMTNDSRRV